MRDVLELAASARPQTVANPRREVFKAKPTLDAGLVQESRHVLTL
jgi:hypothetical protein